MKKEKTVTKPSRAKKAKATGKAHKATPTVNYIPIHAGAMVSEKMKEAGVTHHKLAMAMGVSRGNISYLLKKVNWGTEGLRLVGQILGIDLFRDLEAEETKAMIREKDLLIEEKMKETEQERKGNQELNSQIEKLKGEIEHWKEMVKVLKEVMKR